MKVIDERNIGNWRDLESASPGAPIQFKDSFHGTNCRPDDVFIVNSMSGCYRPAKHEYRGKVAITNIRTGHMSYLEKDRAVRFINVECTITDCCE